jgi:hypothetical protein
MPQMGKMIKRAAWIFLLLLFFLTLFFWYRNDSSYQKALPANTSWAVKIQVDGLLKDLALNALAHPSYYLAQRSKDATSHEKEVLKRGFNIPANVFAFGVKGQPNAIFTRLALADSSHFKAFIAQHLKVNAFTQNQNYTLGLSENQQIQVLFNDTLAVLAYFIKNPAQELVEQVFYEDQFLQKRDPLLARLKASKSHLTLIQDQKNIAFHFDGGQIKMQGSLPMPADWQVPEKINTPPFDPESALTFYFMGKVKKAADLHAFLPKIRAQMEADSLLGHLKGGITVQAKKPVVQQDSVITYEYDDNFEKVAVPTVQERKVPGLAIVLQGDAPKMLQYLESVQALQGAKLNREVSPFLDLGVFSPTAEKVVLSNSTFSNAQIQGTTYHFAQLEIDFQQLETYQLPVFHFPLGNFDKLTVKASKKGEVIQLYGSLGFLDTEINALTQLKGLFGR